jgi:peroxidase
MATRDALLTTMVLLLAAVSVAAAAMAPMDIGDDLLVDLQLQQDPCPQVEDMVGSAVQAALRRNIQLTAGLLRIFFHDCFPQVS